MKILVVGGGSGGHITPAVAVVREIFNQKPRASVEFWTDFKYYKNVTKLTTEIGVSWGEENKSEHRGKGPYIRVRRIPAGKFHRYAGWKFKDYFVHLDITLKDLIFGNIIGFFGFVFIFSIKIALDIALLSVINSSLENAFESTNVYEDFRFL